MPDGSPWPRISIVTPSLSQGWFIEETIRSVLLQGYPNLEYIIIDGGSTDRTLEVLKEYEPWLAYWVSEPDRGQAHAINKGFQRAAGEIITWFNADDVYLKRSFQEVANSYTDNPLNIIQGKGVILNSVKGNETYVTPSDFTLENILRYWEGAATIFVPGLFYPRRLLDSVGLLDESLTCTFDIDFVCRLLAVSPVHYMDAPVAFFRFHSSSKTVARPLRFQVEWGKVSARYWYHIGNTKEEIHCQITNHLIKKASARLRSLDLKGFLELFYGSYSISKKSTIRAITRELARLAMGGRLTGRV